MSAACCVGAGGLVDLADAGHGRQDFHFLLVRDRPFQAPIATGWQGESCRRFVV